MINIKKEKGSITLFVLITGMFFIVVLLLINIALINKKAEQGQQIDKINGVYAVNSGELEFAYEAAVAGKTYVTVEEMNELMEQNKQEMNELIEQTKQEMNELIDKEKQGIKDEAKAEITEQLQDSISSLETRVNNSITTSANNAKTQAKLEAFPVGSIFISTTATNPGSYIGGTWVAYAQGRTLVGVGYSDRTFNAGETGGESAHVLTYSELPYKVLVDVGDNKAAWGIFWANATGYYADVVSRALGNGSDNPHNNLQPYIVTYIWRRTA